MALKLPDNLMSRPLLPGGMSDGTEYVTRQFGNRDPLSATLHKQRMTYAKDYIWLGRNLVDLAERLRMRANADYSGGELNEETLNALKQ